MSHNNFEQTFPGSLEHIRSTMSCIFAIHNRAQDYFHPDKGQDGGPGFSQKVPKNQPRKYGSYDRKRVIHHSCIRKHDIQRQRHLLREVLFAQYCEIIPTREGTSTDGL